MRRFVDVLAVVNETVTHLKVFDNTTRTGSCSDQACPGLQLSTPQGCICTCGNGFTLNASGKMCIPQPNYVEVVCKEGVCVCGFLKEVSFYY